jgi:hypothetical protein
LPRRGAVPAPLLECSLSYVALDLRAELVSVALILGFQAAKQIGALGTVLSLRIFDVLIVAPYTIQLLAHDLDQIMVHITDGFCARAFANHLL